MLDLTSPAFQAALANAPSPSPPRAHAPRVAGDYETPSEEQLRALAARLLATETQRHIGQALQRMLSGEVFAERANPAEGKPGRNDTAKSVAFVLSREFPKLDPAEMAQLCAPGIRAASEAGSKMNVDKFERQLESALSKPPTEGEAMANEYAPRLAALTAQLAAQHPAANTNAAPVQGAPFTVANNGLEFWDLAIEPPPRNYLVQALELAPGRPTGLVGYSNTGKTTVAQGLAFAIAMGLPAWGIFPVRRANVLHLDWEAGDTVRENYARLARAHGISLAELGASLGAARATKYLIDDDAEAWLTHVIKQAGAGFVVVDALLPACPGLDENKAEIAKPLYLLERVSRATGAAFLLLHHERKPDGEKRGQAHHAIRGHGSIHGALQTAISLMGSPGRGEVDLQPSKVIRRGFEPFRLRFVDVANPEAGNIALIGSQAAGEASWGLKLERATVAAAAGRPDSSPAQIDARQMAVGDTVLATLERIAPDGRPLGLQEIKVGYGPVTDAVLRLAIKALVYDKRLSSDTDLCNAKGRSPRYSLPGRALSCPAAQQGSWTNVEQSEAAEAARSQARLGLGSFQQTLGEGPAPTELAPNFNLAPSPNLIGEG